VLVSGTAEQEYSCHSVVSFSISCRGHLGSSHSASVRLATKEPEKGSLVSTRCYSLGSSAANLTEDLQQWPLAGNSGSGHCRRLLLLAVVVDLWWPSATIHSTASDAEIRMIID
jgi:hypothetical protein